MIKKFFCKNIHFFICLIFVLFFCYNFFILKLILNNLINNTIYFHITFILVIIINEIFPKKYNKIQHNYNTIFTKFYNKISNNSSLPTIISISLFYLLLFCLYLNSFNNIIPYIAWGLIITSFLFIIIQEIIIFYKTNKNELSNDFDKSLYLFLTYTIFLGNSTWYLVLTLFLFEVYI